MRASDKGYPGGQAARDLVKFSRSVQAVVPRGKSARGFLSRP